jgi:hypothetical protein
MMPLPVRRKTRTMEKVENCYRTARAPNESIDTIGTRWNTSDHACAILSRWCDSRRQAPPAEVALPPGWCARADLGAIRRGQAAVAADQDAGGHDRRVAVLAGYEDFRRRIFRILRRPGSAPKAIAKVQAFGTKLLAMLRAPL